MIQRIAKKSCSFLGTEFVCYITMSTRNLLHSFNYLRSRSRLGNFTQATLLPAGFSNPLKGAQHCEVTSIEDNANMLIVRTKAVHAEKHIRTRARLPLILALRSLASNFVHADSYIMTIDGADYRCMQIDAEYWIAITCDHRIRIDGKMFTAMELDLAVKDKLITPIKTAG